MSYGKSHKVEAGLAILVAGIAFGGSTGVAQTQTHAAVVPDAQVESNVLKAIATDQRLAGTTIRTTAVYGTVTLSGSVPDEATRVEAETVVSKTAGVLKVVDELTLGSESSAAQAAVPGATPNAQTNGPGAPPDAGQQPRYDAPSQAQAGPPPSGAGFPQENPSQDSNRPGQNTQGSYGAPPPPYPNGSSPDGSTGGYGAPAPYPNSSATAQGTYGPPPPPQNGGGYSAQAPYPGQYPSQSQNQYPGQYPAAGNPSYSGGQGGYPPSQYPDAGQQAYGPPPAYPAGANPAYAGQVGGQPVTLPSGTVLRVRLNGGVSSRDAQPGTPFDGVVANDIISSGAVAIPRGAAVHGVVVDAERAGTLKGRGELHLRLTDVVLGGTTYPISSDLWSAHGSDKTVRTVDSAVGLGAVGAVLGAVAGGGAGAAIGAGVGGAVGVGSSAASGAGQVGVPPESIIDFHLEQPVEVATLSQAELNRLGYGVPAGAPRGMVRRYPGPYPYPYYGPVIYGPGYYGPRYYPRYYRYRPY